MVNKTAMVARREFLENVRTKTFWIGILMFPVIWAVVLTVPSLLSKTKGVRKYAVVDKSTSGWFMDAFRRKTETLDLAKLYGDWKAPEKRASLSNLPSSLTSVFDALHKAEQARNAEFDGPQLQSVFKGYSTIAQLTDEQIEKIEPFIPLIAGLLDKLPKSVLDGMTGNSNTAQLDIKQALERGDINATSITKLRDDARTMIDASSAWLHELANSSGASNEEIAARYQSTNATGRFERVEPTTESDLRKRVDEGKLFALFVVPEDPVGKRPKSDPSSPKDPSDRDLSSPKFTYVTTQEHLADRELREWFQTQATDIVRERRIAKLGVKESDADWLGSEIRFDDKQMKGGEEAEVSKSDVVGQFAPVVFVYLLWISVFTIANLLLTNTIEEKSNRLIEVLLSSVSPLQLMMGKILGLAGTGLTMVASWAFFAILGIKLAPLFGENFAATIGNWGLEQIITNPRYLASFLIYFVFGYLLYAALLVGIGSVCNSLKEAQNLMQPVVLMLIVPLLAMIPIAQEPNGTLAKVMSYIPPFTPFVMMNRAGGPPSLVEYGLTTLLLIATVGVAILFAAKIFRIGILMTGKPPKIREILSWLKAPVGSVYVREEQNN